MLKPKLFMKFLSGSLRAMKQILVVSSFDDYLKNHSHLFQAKVWYFYWGVNLASYLSFFKVRPKTIVRFHRYDLYESESNRIPFREELLRNITEAVCISDDGQRHLQSFYPEFKSKIKVYRLGSREAGVNPEMGEILRIVSCSSLLEVKRVHLIPEILKYVDKEIEWVHFGTGKDHQSLQDQCKSLPQNVTVTFKGYVPNKEVLNYYRNEHVDLFLNVSSSEGIPVSIMEAMSFGIPVLATDIPGNMEIVYPEVGILIPVHFDPKTVAEAMLSYLTTGDHSLIRSRCRESWENNYNAEKNYSMFVSYLASQ